MPSEPLTSKRKPDLTIWTIGILSSAFLISLLSILGLWLHQAWPAISKFGSDLITGKEWFYRDQLFGAAPMIYGSVIVALIALFLAAPIAVCAAVFISEYLPKRSRAFAKTAVEFLAAVPSVVYGLLGIILLREWIYERLIDFDPLSGDMLITAGVLLAIMILPTITTFSEDALRAVPESQRTAARGLGLTRAESILTITFPQAWRGIIGACLLGTGRALGETIAVFLVIGRLDNQLPENLLNPELWIEPGQTLTSKLGGPETHISIGDPIHWASMLTLGLILLVVSTLMLLSGSLIANLKKRTR